MGAKQESIMGGMKLFAVLNGIFYVAYGLFGLFQPATMAGLMGWDASLLGLHEVRAIWCALAATGLIILWASRNMSDLVPLVKAIMLVTAAFFVGRVFGLVLDGAGPQLTYIEMGLEVFVLIFGAITLRGAKV